MRIALDAAAAATLKKNLNFAAKMAAKKVAKVATRKRTARLHQEARQSKNTLKNNCPALATMKVA